jgi:hypothetical protein
MIHFVHVLLLFISWFYVILLVLTPISLRMRFRLSARVDPTVMQVVEMPEVARAYIEARIAEFRNWNFELVSYVDLGEVTPSTRAYLALLSNPHTAEWADATFIISPVKKYGYFEFITRCSEQMQIDTNTSPAAPIFFPVPQHHIFRLPQVGDVFKLYRVHRMLVTEITHGALPVIPAAGEEIAELKRRVNRYGPWQQDHGYMFLDSSGENYRLTWKGAILGAWRSIWPISLFRSWRQSAKNRAVLDRAGAAG